MNRNTGILKTVYTWSTKQITGIQAKTVYKGVLIQVQHIETVLIVSPLRHKRSSVV